MQRRSKERAVGYARCDGTGRNRADAGDGCQTPANLVRTMPGQNVAFEPFDLLFQPTKLTDRSLERQTCQSRETILGLLQGHGRNLHAGRSFGSNDPIFRQVPA